MSRLGFLRYWREALLAVCALALGAQTLRLSRAERDLANREKQHIEAVLAAQREAERLSNELVIQQAIAMSVTSKKAGSYVGQIQSAPDAERMRIGSRGVRDLVAGSGRPPAVGGAPAALH